MHELFRTLSESFVCLTRTYMLIYQYIVATQALTNRSLVEISSVIQVIPIQVIYRLYIR